MYEISDWMRNVVTCVCEVGQYNMMSLLYTC